jgi:putative membrane protein
MNFIIKLFLNAIAVFITASILPGVHLVDFWNGLLLAAILAVLNASVKPVLIFLTIPATIFTLGLFLLVINALIVELAAWILHSGFSVDSFWWALLFALVLSFITGIFDRLTVKSQHRDDSVKVYDKDGKRIV